MAAAQSDAHRRFLQALLARGVVEAAEAERLRRLCCQLHQAPRAPDPLDDFIGGLNAQLQPFSMEIRKGSAEDSGKAYFALVNLAETEITKMASDFSENELELFKKTSVLLGQRHLRQSVRRIDARGSASSQLWAKQPPELG